jgi:hypothetical protein
MAAAPLVVQEKLMVRERSPSHTSCLMRSNRQTCLNTALSPAQAQQLGASGPLQSMCMVWHMQLHLPCFSQHPC